jgi:hypothetical protein
MYLWVFWPILAQRIDATNLKVAQIAAGGVRWIVTF